MKSKTIVKLSNRLYKTLNVVQDILGFCIQMTYNCKAESEKKSFTSHPLEAMNILGYKVFASNLKGCSNLHGE